MLEHIILIVIPALNVLCLSEVNPAWFLWFILLVYCCICSLSFYLYVLVNVNSEICIFVFVLVRFWRINLDTVVFFLLWNSFCHKKIISSLNISKNLSIKLSSPRAYYGSNSLINFQLFPFVIIFIFLKSAFTIYTIAYTIESIALWPALLYI